MERMSIAVSTEIMQWPVREKNSKILSLRLSNRRSIVGLICQLRPNLDGQRASEGDHHDTVSIAMIMFVACGSIHVQHASKQKGKLCFALKESLIVCRQLFCSDCITPNYQFAAPLSLDNHVSFH